MIRSFTFSLLVLLAACNETNSIDTAMKNGYTVAFSSSREQWEIYQMDIEGMNVKKLTAHNGISTLPSWSPDGSKIAYVCNSAGSVKDLYLMDRNGANAKNISLSGVVGSLLPVWSADGSKILFRENDRLCVINADGTGKKGLTPNIYGQFNPSFSPNGSKILFSQSPNAFTTSDDIFVMNADGSGIVDLSVHDASDFQPQWSADGSKIIFASNRGGRSAVYSMNIFGENIVRLSDTTKNSYVPVISPDGKMILYLYGTDGTDYELFTMNLDGTNRRQLTSVPKFVQRNGISWHKGSNQIFFVEAETVSGGSLLNIWMINPDGTHQMKMTTYSGINTDPMVSPVEIP
jgi:Tol biopolymer transport system component